MGDVLWPVQVHGTGRVQKHAADGTVHCPSVRVHVVQGFYQGIQSVTLATDRRGIARPGLRRQLLRRGPGPIQLVQHFLLVGLVGVEFQAERPKAVRPQTPMHHIQRGALFRHKQDAPTQRKVVRNHVGDGLRLARARWARPERSHSREPSRPPPQAARNPPVTG